ncbi:DUF2000 family protein [Streptomyces argenteolus]
MFRQPVLVLAGANETLTTAHTRAVGRGTITSVFTSDLVATGPGKADRAAVRAVGRDGPVRVGPAFHGPRDAVDKIPGALRRTPGRQRCATGRARSGTPVRVNVRGAILGISPQGRLVFVPKGDAS